MKINTMIYSQTVTFTCPHFQPHLNGASFLGTALKSEQITNQDKLISLFVFVLTIGGRAGRLVSRRPDIS